MTDETKQLDELLKDNLSRLSEHFDAVQIFCSNLSDDGEFTTSLNRGAGNFHTRRDMAREWIEYHDEINRIKARKDSDAEQ